MTGERNVENVPACLARGAPVFTVARAASRAIRIGCNSALSEARAVSGCPIMTGALIATEQINDQGGLLGRPIEIVSANAHADPATAADWVTTLSQQRVNLLFGCVTQRSGVGLRLATAALERSHDHLFGPDREAHSRGLRPQHVPRDRSRLHGATMSKPGWKA